MKKITKILLVVFSLFCTINVHAANIEDKGKFNSGLNYGFSGAGTSGGGYSMPATLRKYALKKDGKEYSAYCLDVTKLSVDSNKAINCTKMGINSAYNAGLIAIGKNGYNVNTQTSNEIGGIKISGDSYYAATNIALRLYKIAMTKSWTGNAFVKDVKDGKYNMSGDYNYSMVNTAVDWMYDNFDLYKKATGYSGKKDKSALFNYTGLSGKGAINEYTSYKKTTDHHDNKTDDNFYTLRNTDNSVYKVAKKLFVIGLTEASEYKKNPSAYKEKEKDKENKDETKKATVTVSNINSNGSSSVAGGTTSRQDTETHLVSLDYVTITLKNFTKDDKFSDVSISCLNCGSVANGNSSVTISRYSLDGGNTYVNGTPTNDKLKDITGDKKIVLEITTKVKKDSLYNCDDVKFKISYKFVLANSSSNTTNTPSDENETNITGIYSCQATDSNSEYQEFYNIEAWPGINDSDPDNSDGDTDDTGDDGTDNYIKSKEFKVNFCVPNGPACIEKDPQNMTDEEKQECCDDWEDACVNGNNYCTYVGEYCVTCDTKINHPTACTDFDDAGESEGEVVEALDENGNDNTKKCLLMRKKDEAGNSYLSSSNDYCEVYCKEEFDYKLPGAVSINSGTYFQLEATITGTKSCYTSKIDTNKFKTDLEAIKADKDAGRISASDYNTKRDDIVKQYNSCVNLDEEYSCFEPKIKYEYDEDYDNGINESSKEFTRLNVTTSDDNTEYCTGEVNDSYTCQGSHRKGSITVDGVTYSTADYVKTTITKTANYKTPSVFYTKTPTGAIVSQQEYDRLAESQKNNYNVVNGLPVSIKTESGNHKFTLTLSNIGEFYNESRPGACKTGRLIGADNSVFDKNKNTKAEYDCKYFVNCPECDFDCVGPLCNIETCDGPNCVPTCIGYGCAYTNGGLSYAYRTVSLVNLNPTDRELGYNWNTNAAKNKAAAKATAAITEITNGKEDIYEEEPIYTFKITPALQRKIKEHNKLQLGNGGFANESLECKDYVYNGKTYENVNCKSTFIEGLNSGEFANNVVVPSEKGKQTFTNWFESKYCQDHVCTTGKGIGPSYK